MISVVIPVLNESENISNLIYEIREAAARAPISEIVVVDDASTDDTIEVVKSMRNDALPLIKIFSHGVRSGQSAALRTGIRHASYTLVVTMDGDGQNNPADIPALYQKWSHGNLSMPMRLIAGQREKRIDSLLKKITSRLGNSIRNFVLQDGVRDTGCSLKLFRRDDYLALPYFNHMHRYLPALFLREHGSIELVNVSHRSREAGISKYGFWDRAFAGLSDLLGVLWLKTRRVQNTLTKEI